MLHEFSDDGREAINRRQQPTRKGQQWVADPCYFDVVVFGKSAETIGQSVSKDQAVLLQDRL